MRRWVLIAAGALVFVLVAGQILIPPLGEHRVEDRLTEGGGEAEVTLGAVPAMRLLFSDGERVEIAARDLEIEIERDSEALAHLDGFDVVQISIAESRIGPFDLETFELTRDGEGPYSLSSTGTTSARRLADFGFETVELPGEGLLDALLEPFFGERDLTVPLDLEMQLTSDEGRLRVVSGGGTIAGIPMGPIAELITAAIVVRI